MKIDIRSLDFKMTHLLEATLNREIQQALDVFSERIETVYVTIKDLNGPKGGEDKSLILRISPVKGNSLIVSGKGADLYSLIGDVCRRAKAVFAKKKNRREDNYKKAA